MPSRIQQVLDFVDFAKVDESFVKKKPLRGTHNESRRKLLKSNHPDLDLAAYAEEAERQWQSLEEEYPARKETLQRWELLVGKYDCVKDDLQMFSQNNISALKEKLNEKFGAPEKQMMLYGRLGSNSNRIIRIKLKGPETMPQSSAIIQSVLSQLAITAPFGVGDFVVRQKATQVLDIHDHPGAATKLVRLLKEYRSQSSQGDCRQDPEDAIVYSQMYLEDADVFKVTDLNVGISILTRENVVFNATDGFASVGRVSKATVMIVQPLEPDVLPVDRKATLQHCFQFLKDMIPPKRQDYPPPVATTKSKPASVQGNLASTVVSFTDFAKVGPEFIQQVKITPNSTMNRRRLARSFPLEKLNIAGYAEEAGKTWQKLMSESEATPAWEMIIGKLDLDKKIRHLSLHQLSMLKAKLNEKYGAPEPQITLFGPLGGNSKRTIRIKLKGPEAMPQASMITKNNLSRFAITAPFAIADLSVSLLHEEQALELPGEAAGAPAKLVRLLKSYRSGNTVQQDPKDGNAFEYIYLDEVELFPVRDHNVGISIVSREMIPFSGTGQLGKVRKHIRVLVRPLNADAPMDLKALLTSLLQLLLELVPPQRSEEANNKAAESKADVKQVQGKGEAKAAGDGDMDLTKEMASLKDMKPKEKAKEGAVKEGKKGEGEKPKVKTNDRFIKNIAKKLSRTMENMLMEVEDYGRGLKEGLGDGDRSAWRQSLLDSGLRDISLFMEAKDKPSNLPTNVWEALRSPMCVSQGGEKFVEGDTNLRYVSRRVLEDRPFLGATSVVCNLSALANKQHTVADAMVRVYQSFLMTLTYLPPGAVDESIRKMDEDLKRYAFVLNDELLVTRLRATDAPFGCTLRGIVDTDLHTVYQHTATGKSTPISIVKGRPVVPSAGGVEIGTPLFNGNSLVSFFAGPEIRLPRVVDAMLAIRNTLKNGIRRV